MVTSDDAAGVAIIVLIALGAWKLVELIQYAVQHLQWIK